MIVGTPARGASCSSTLVLKGVLFVDAARARACARPGYWCGISCPTLMSPILVQLTFCFAHAILAEAGLSFLGVGVPPDIPTWAR